MADVASLVGVVQVIGWRKLVVTTALATLFAVVMDKAGVIEKLAALIP
jgi:hypothetical protein